MLQLPRKLKKVAEFSSDFVEMSEKNVILEEIKASATAAAEEICKVGKLGKGDVLVVGCSSSEIVGGLIGHESTPEAAEAVYAGISSVCNPRGIFIAAQCCEHLNRAIIIEKAALAKMPLVEVVNVVPQPKAGGSFATAAYNKMNSPCAIEHVKADAGLDIGSTLIGMHLKEVAVPVRLSVKSIGKAPLTAARVRPKFIGGIRAVYDEELL